jgi:hypothetical protein
VFVQPAVCQHGKVFFLGKKSFFVYFVPFYMRINVVRRRSQDELSCSELSSGLYCRVK